jgi:PKD repeat protein
VRYEWLWGDGESAARTAPDEDHDYPRSGVYPVTLMVTDDAGVTGSVTQVLSVN